MRLNVPPGLIKLSAVRDDGDASTVQASTTLHVREGDDLNVTLDLD